METLLANRGSFYKPADVEAVWPLALGAVDAVTLYAPGRADQQAIRLTDQAITLTQDDVADGLVLANHAIGRGVRIRIDVEGIDRVVVRPDAPRGCIALAVRIPPFELEPGSGVYLRQHVEVLTDLGAVPQASQ